MNAVQDALRDAKCSVAALAARFGCPPMKNAIFIFKHTTDCLLAQSPHFGDFGDGVVLLQSRCRLAGVLDWFFTK